MGNNEACCWPEQEAVEDWIKKYDIRVTHEQSHELKKAVTAYRIEVQGQLERLRGERNSKADGLAAELEIEREHTDRYLKETRNLRRQFEQAVEAAAYGSAAALKKVWVVKRIECDATTSDPIAAVVVKVVSFATSPEEAAREVHKLEQGVEMYEGWLTLASTGNCMFPQFVVEEVDRA